MDVDAAEAALCGAPHVSVGITQAVHGTKKKKNSVPLPAKTENIVKPMQKQ